MDLKSKRDFRTKFYGLSRDVCERAVIAEGQLWAKQHCIEPLYMQGPNPTDPILLMGSHTILVGYNTATVTCYRKEQTYRRSEKTQCQQS